jgi:hypothetical protein
VVNLERHILGRGEEPGARDMASPQEVLSTELLAAEAKFRELDASGQNNL